jgi:aryl-alcohol dehydrogenase-like predicted oxidoreductase
MKYRDFGKSGLKVSEIGFGGWAIGGDSHGNSYGHTDDKASVAAIQRSIDLGCNFFDTADVYGWGHSETLIGQAIRGKRERVILAAKVGADFESGAGVQNFSAEYVRTALEKTLSRLGTDYVDVYQLHNPPLRLIGLERTYEILKILKREGKIRTWGLSIFDPTEGLVALRVSQPDSLQVTYNLFNPRVSEVLFSTAQEAGCAIIAREVLANGFLTGKYDENVQFESGDFRAHWRRDFIAARVRAAQRLSFLVKPGKRTLAQACIGFVFSNQAVAVALTGVKTVEQAEENFGASEAPSLKASEEAEIKRLQANDFDI